MATMNQFRSEDIDICYTDTGTGTPVMLVHGFTASSDMWSGFPEIEGLRIIKIDCRGHGASDKPDQADRYGRHLVRDLYNLIHHLDLTQVHLIGYSMGAEISLCFASSYPDCVRSLIVAGSGWSQQADADNYNLLSQTLAETGSFADVLKSWSPDSTEQEIAAINSLIGTQDPVVLAAVAGGMQDIVCLPAEALRACGFPTLGLAGEFDPERGNVERLQDVFADFRMTVLPGADHMSAIADPAFYRAIESFLRSA